MYNVASICVVGLGNQSPVAKGTMFSYVLSETQVTETLSIDLAPYFEDPEGDALMYAVYLSNPSMATASITGSNLFLTIIGSGSTSVNVVADDGNSNTLQSFTLQVR